MAEGASSPANATKEEDPDGGGSARSPTGMSWQALRPTAPGPEEPEMCVSADGGWVKQR